MNETEYRLRLKGEIDIEAVIAATSESDAIIANMKEIITNEITLKFVCAEIAD